MEREDVNIFWKFWTVPSMYFGTHLLYSFEAVVECDTVWGSPQGEVGPEDTTDKSEIDRKLRLLPVRGSSKES